MIEHNVVSVGGIEHKAVMDVSSKGCSACALNDHLDENGDCDVKCVPTKRSDKCSVIFKRHYKPKHNEIPIKVIEL